MCVALVLGKNIRLRRRELLVVWAGVLGYGALVVAGLAQGQRAPCALAAALMPFLVARAVFTTRHALVLRRTHSQGPGHAVKAAEERAQPVMTRWRRAQQGVLTRRQMLKHGTHMVLTALLFAKPARARGATTAPVGAEGSGARGRGRGVGRIRPAGARPAMPGFGPPVKV